MFGKRKNSEILENDRTPKRRRHGSPHTNSSLSSRVVIEELDKRNKRRKVPVGRRYVPGSIKQGPLVPVNRETVDPRTLRNVGLASALGLDDTTVSMDDFNNIVFEESFPPQRNRQASKWISMLMVLTDDSK